jgi:hypothetical protein
MSTPTASGDWIYYWDVQNFCSPFVKALITQLNTATGDPIAAMLDPAFLANPDPNVVQPAQQFTTDPKSPLAPMFHPYAIDFDPQQPYANYHWELGFHLLHAIADAHHHNGRYDEELTFLNYILDTSSTDSVAPPAKFWKFLYFRQYFQNPDALTSIVDTLNDPNASTSAMNAIVKSYTDAMLTPFQPFLVARARPICFAYYTVMKLLDCYLAKADTLLAEPMTIERVNEATQWVIKAANLLGPRPQQIPQIGTTAAMSYDDLAKLGLDALGDALVNLESQFPFNLTTSTAQPPWATGQLLGVTRTVYFCIPEDQTLLGYWDTVEDRLFKIRNCENLAGQVQLMPLFDPPINPGLLVAAAAAGLDIASAVAGLNQPVSAVRTPMLIRKALEMAAEVRTLGNELLAALEKQDAQHLASLRQQNDTKLQNLIIDTRQLQYQQTLAATATLQAQRLSAYERYSYYMHLFGNPPIELTPIDTSIEITEANLDQAYTLLVSQFGAAWASPAIAPYSTYTMPQSVAPSALAGATNPGPLYLSNYEDQELNTNLPDAKSEQENAASANQGATLMAILPNLTINLQPLGCGPSAGPIGGETFANVARLVAEGHTASAAGAQADATSAAKTAGYQRRADDWTFQLNLAVRELQTIGTQLLTAIIAQQAANQELSNAQTQAADSGQLLDYMTTMFTTEDLYGWMQGELFSQYQQYYQFATDLARKAEATMKWELMRPELDGTTYIQPNYFNNTWNGLTAGDALLYDIKRLETDYDNYNLRELELTQHVSLRQLNPLALLNLTISGSCSVSVPEWLYDLRCPGHYMRRIKTVAVSVPCVPGPYTHVNCTATLQNSTVRTTPGPQGGPYGRSSSGDDLRFIDYYGAPDSVVTSSGTNDSGMFETTLRDDRFLPFEGAGAISTWTLALPPLRTFDYSTITDVILHIRYTARDGGVSQAGQATAAVENQFTGKTSPSGQALLFCLRHDFPDDWYAFVNATDATAPFTTTLSKQRFPYVVQNSTKLAIDSLTLYSGGQGTQDTTIQPPFPIVPIGPSLSDLSTSLTGGEATLTFSIDPSLPRTLTSMLYLVVGYHFVYGS